MFKKNTTMLSLEKSRMVRGYEIKRLPLGAYLETVEIIREAPMQMLASVFQGKDAAQALEMLSTLDTERLRETLLNALTRIPAQGIKLVSKLLGVAEKDLLENPDIGLDGLAEMLTAWMELNNIENFLRAVRPLSEQIRAALGVSRRQNIGSNA